MTTLEEELRSWRARAVSAAGRPGRAWSPAATSPVAVEPRLVSTPRYREMAERFGIVTREQLTCGCHVHVAVTSPEEAVGVLDRIRAWLPSLLALSANSPYWQGRDTGYASFRWQAQGRWPVSGPPEVFGTAAGYRALVDGMLASEVILDEAMLYLDARCSKRYPTVEIRVADVCLDVRDTVLVAALVRGLVETAAEEWAAGQPAPPVPTALLRLATWQAARWGIGGTLLDPLTSRPRPAREVVTALVDHVRPALRASGDEALVTDRIEQGLRPRQRVDATTGGFREDRSPRRRRRRSRPGHRGPGRPLAGVIPA